MNLPWIEKYRPKYLDDMIDHEEKINTLKKLIHNNELPHLLFYGPPGTGKTSLILASARELYGDDYRKYILELNASDDRGIDIVRNKIPNFIKTKSDKLRLIILDEADAMTQDAQSALRRVMEKYISTSRFCLICNNINKIVPGIQSRCSKMRFGILDAQQIAVKIRYITEKENVNIDDEAINILINVQRDFRQILNVLQCIHYIRLGENVDASNNGANIVATYDQITADDIYQYLGKPTKAEVTEIINKMFNDTFHHNFSYLKTIFRQNKWNILDLISNLSDYIINTPEVVTEPQRYYLLGKLSKVEYRIVTGHDSEIQLASLVAYFIKSKTIGGEFPP
jgi:replication factor C subunit 3/5